MALFRFVLFLWTSVSHLCLALLIRLQQSDQHKFECSMKAIELLIEQRNLAGLGERISQVPPSSFLHAPAFLFICKSLPSLLAVRAVALT
jgi:hypothetical protein